MGVRRRTWGHSILSVPTPRRQQVGTLKIECPPYPAAGSGRGVGRGNGSVGAPFLVAILELIQLEVDAALGEQGLVAAGLAQVPLVQDEDLVHVLDRREPVRDG